MYRRVVAETAVARETTTNASGMAVQSNLANCCGNADGPKLRPF
jgi:hypothetical protein